ncbi:MAG: Hint domain-containing protein [Myxococcaceae bacterium]|nr:Hint domain-containing protein [Myxococcaceae bacterium]
MKPLEPASCCVARGTRVRTRDGEKAVEFLRVGDEVTAVDPLSGRRVSTRVVDVRVSRRECLSLRSATVTMECTTDHHLFDPDAQAFADAGDWALGKRSHVTEVPEDDDEPLRAVAVSSDARYVTVLDVFDVAVEDALHTFVANGLLVGDATRAA